MKKDKPPLVSFDLPKDTLKEKFLEPGHCFYLTALRRFQLASQLCPTIYWIGRQRRQKNSYKNGSIFETILLKIINTSNVQSYFCPATAFFKREIKTFQF